MDKVKYIRILCKFIVVWFILISSLPVEATFAASPNSSKTFAISSSGEFTKKATISNLVVNVNQSFSLYFYATNGGKAQCPEVLEDMPLAVNLINPNGQSTNYNLIIPKGPANTYGILTNISCNVSGKWIVKVSGDPGKGTVTVTDTFTVVGEQTSLNIIPPAAIISMGSTQQFEAVINNDNSSNGITGTALDYALFSGSTSSTLALNGSEFNINGSTHTNKDFVASVYKLNISGKCEAVKSVTLNGNQNDIKIGEVVQNASSVTMPDVNDEIIALAQETGQIYSSSKMFSGNNFTFDSPVYVNGNLDIYCNQFKGTGPIVATGNITIYSTSLSVTNNAPVCLYSKNGNITVGNSSVDLNGLVYAPNGTITMNGSILTILGRVIGKEVVIHPYKLTIDSSNNDLSSLITTGETPNPQITWSSSNPNVATINASGLATSVGPGTCTITASCTVNNILYTDTAQLTVVLPTLEITPAYTTISSGSTQQYHVLRTDYDEDPIDITSSVLWSTSTSGYPFLASVTISQSGLASVQGDGTFTITATDSSSGVSCTATLIIRMPTININPDVTNIVSGATQQYYARLTDFSGNSTIITDSAHWSSNDTNVAIVSDSGLVTGKVAGSCQITVLDSISGANSNFTLTVMVPTQLKVISTNTEALNINDTLQLSAILVYPDGSTKDVTDSVIWTSENANVAACDDDGEVTGQGGGQCVITAMDTVSGLSGEITVSVKPALILSPSSKVIPIGFNQQYNALLVYADGTEPQDVTGRVTWLSSDTGIAEIDSSGLATGKSEGSCKITANDNTTGSQGSSELTIKNVTDLKITPVLDVLFEGNTQQFKLKFSDGTVSDVLTDIAEWTSSNSHVASIKSGLVQGIKAGTCTITATVQINGQTFKGSFLLTVIPKEGGIIRAWEQ